MKLLALASIGLLTACATAGMPAQPSDAPDPSADAPMQRDSGSEPPVDAAADGPIIEPDAPPPAAAALLLSEVVVQPAGAELIEIFNPGNSPVDLSHYYLADHGNYFRVPSNTATVDSSDFIVKFPPNATIPAHGVITVSIDTAALFNTAYGLQPTYSIKGGTMISIVANGAASLTNQGELVALFYWDGTSDLVRDVDLMLVGKPTAANGLVDKSGYGLDGPDAGNTPSTYAPDARTLLAQAAEVTAGVSTKRVSLETGNEVQNGSGNGLTGDDETTENTVMSWDTSYTAPTPGVVPAALLP
ncbi:MAG: lamin tail domain-containing protein [Kofleriaceae bacterium]|nr:lamin tail domain-containing protein [Kofleriaceae bacterium]